MTMVVVVAITRTGVKLIVDCSTSARANSWAAVVGSECRWGSEASESSSSSQ